MKSASQAEAQILQVLLRVLKLATYDSKFGDGIRSRFARPRVHGAPSVGIYVAARKGS